MHKPICKIIIRSDFNLSKFAGLRMEMRTLKLSGTAPSRTEWTTFAGQVSRHVRNNAAQVERYPQMNVSIQAKLHLGVLTICCIREFLGIPTLPMFSNHVLYSA